MAKTTIFETKRLNIVKIAYLENGFLSIIPISIMKQ